MVRTLDFQSKNVGSIPPNPIILLNFKYLNSFNSVKFYNYYSFFFISLIPPFFLSNFTNFFATNLKYKKIQLKQSYVLFTWFFHMTSFEKFNTKTPKFFILPIKKKTFTQIKAPIAHKNWSKEQFNFKFYLIKLSFKSNFRNFEVPHSVNLGFFFILTIKQHFPVFETNILFLKSYKIIFSLKDKNYFNYFKFL